MHFPEVEMKQFLYIEHPPPPPNVTPTLHILTVLLLDSLEKMFEIYI